MYIPQQAHETTASNQEFHGRPYHGRDIEEKLADRRDTQFERRERKEHNMPTT